MQPMACLYTLFESVEAADQVAQTLLAERWVACANIHAPCHSLYHWHGEVARAEEIPVLFKLPAAAANAAAARLAELHPYDTPAIVVWAAEATPDYAAWLAAETAL